MSNLPVMYAYVAEGIYVGNLGAATDLSFMSNADISAIINLSGETLEPIENVDIFNFLLPSQELMSTEVPKTIQKLEMIAATMQDLKIMNRTVLVNCVNGKNKCMLAVGYYLISKCQWPHDRTVEQLEMMYFDQQQRQDELADRAVMEQDPDMESTGPLVSAAERSTLRAKRAARRNIKCLTMASYRQILRSCAKK
jgi:hypothetical protein